MSDAIICYCEKYGIYEIYKVIGKNTIVYYSYFGSEGFYKITKNIATGKEIRKHLRYTKPPKFLVTENGTRYNYFCG